MATTVIFLTTTGANNWVVPNDFNVGSNRVEVFGAGAGGDAVGGAGAGGAWSKSVNLNLVPGTSISYTNGLGGTPGNAGGDSWFNSGSFPTTGQACGARGGGAPTTITGGTGGPAGNGSGSAGNSYWTGTGSTGNSGGNGGSVATGNPGGGGGAGGPNGAGSAGSNGGVSLGGNGGSGDNGSGGTGGTGTGTTGGTGGNGAEYTQTSDSATGGAGGGGGGGIITGGPGGNYGAGGGGGLTAGGSGTQGFIVISYEPAAVFSSVTKLVSIGAAILSLWQPDSFSYNMGGAHGAQPYSPRLLPPSTIAVPVNDPPGVGIPRWVEIPDPLPTLPRWLPASTLQVPNPQFAHRGRTAATAAIIRSWDPDPWPSVFEGGFQAYSGRPLNDSLEIVPEPPHAHFGRSLDYIEITVAAWQPDYDPWKYTYLGGSAQGRQPYGARLNPPSTLLVPNPPFGHPARTAAGIAVTAQASQPDPWWFSYTGGAQEGRQPYGPRLNPPSTLLVPNPPFTHQGRTVNAVAITAQAAQPPDPLPTLSNKLSPGVPGQSVNTPSFTSEEINQSQSEIVATWRAPDPAPPLPGKLSPSIPGQSVDNPIFTSEEIDQAQSQIVRSWWAATPWHDQRRLGVPPTSVDNPPFQSVGRTSTSQSILQSWQPPDPSSQRGSLFVPPTAAVISGDDPPGVGVPKFVEISDPLPTLPRNLPPSILATHADNPPFGVRLRVMSWAWDAPSFYQVGFGQFIQSVDNPPFITPQNLYAILEAWIPPDPLPTLKSKLPPSTLIVPDPPFQSVGRTSTSQSILQSWQPPDPSSQRGSLFVPPTAAVISGDDPPGVGVPKFVIVDEPLPTLPRNLPPSALAVQADNPPFTQQRPLSWVFWQVEPPAQFARNLSPGIPGQSVDTPPRWREPPRPPAPESYVHPQRSGLLSPGVPGQSVDNPPPAQSRQPYAPSWTLFDPLPTISIKLVQPFVASSADNPPFSARRVPHWPLWQPPDPQPSLGGKLPPSVTAVPVNDPPFTHASRLERNTVLTTWQPPSPDYGTIKMTVKIVQEGPTPPPATEEPTRPMIVHAGRMMGWP